MITIKSGTRKNRLIKFVSIPVVLGLIFSSLSDYQNGSVVPTEGEVTPTSDPNATLIPTDTAVPLSSDVATYLELTSPGDPAVLAGIAPTVPAPPTETPVSPINTVLLPTNTPVLITTTDRRPMAPLVIAGEEAIPDRYIVVYKTGIIPSSAAAADLALIQTLGGQVDFVYTTAVQGYSAYLPPQALEEIRRNPQVDYIQADGWVSIDDDDVGIETVQTGATWGLDRIDQRNLPLSTTYTYNATASNVNAYILDTGINSTHALFGGRATKDYDAIGDGQNGNDCHGHGTHVAGTIGSSTYGVAKAVKLHAVRVLNCSGTGSYSQVIAGVDWVTANHVHPAVANMSLGAVGTNPALESAIQSAINHGVTFVIAAGNNNANACNFTPARLPAGITVGSTTSTDARSSFSNWGTCLDIFAPGSSITSTWIGSNTATNTISGTSMASPHVAGVAVLYLSTHANALPEEVASALISNSTAGMVTNLGTGSPNRLPYSLWSPDDAGTGGAAFALPRTGFAPNRMTSLPAQPARLAYADLGPIWLEIPSQSIQTNIVGVPKSENGWDVKWLNQDAGWLNGTAFPSWVGNSVITAHVTDANGLPGPFANINSLKYGDQIIVHMLDEQYIFEVRSTRMSLPTSTNFAFEHLEDHSYLTLITCQGYDLLSDSYLFRRIVRAVLVDVK